MSDYWWGEVKEALQKNFWSLAEQNTISLLIRQRDQYDDYKKNDWRLISCEVWYSIDCLWKQYSNGLYGLSVQVPIWKSCGGYKYFPIGQHEYSEVFGTGCLMKDAAIENAVITLCNFYKKTGRYKEANAIHERWHYKKNDKWTQSDVSGTKGYYPDFTGVTGTFFVGEGMSKIEQCCCL